MGTRRTADPVIVVIVSANSEWRAVREMLTPEEVTVTPAGEVFRATLNGWKPTFLHSGWGKVAAAAGTQYAIDQFHPDLIVNLGTCGGFRGRIERGTILLVTRTIIYDIFEQMSDADEAISHYSTELDLSWLKEKGQEASEEGVVRGLLVSADRDLLPADIPMLVEKYGAVAGDWESGAIAWVAKRNGVRCLILRGVTDLVSPEGGEAYGDIEVFHENTRLIMRRLIDLLPEWLARIQER